MMMVVSVAAIILASAVIVRVLIRKSPRRVNAAAADKITSTP
jgi:hypothetical protein